MNRFDRLQTILLYLRNNKTITAEELAQSFEVSTRTIYRDIRSLENAGVPIGGEAGLGYFLADGFHLPPISFTQEEAEAILVAGKFLEREVKGDIRSTFKSSLEKIKSVMKTEQKSELEIMDQQLAVNPFENPNMPQVDSLLMTPIKGALQSDKKLTFSYYSPANDSFSQRSVEPIGICHYSNQWHLIAYCLLRNDYRDFRIDRISKLEVLDQHFNRNNRKSLNAYLTDLGNRTALHQMKVQIKNEDLFYFENVKHQMGLIQEENGREYSILTFAIPWPDYFIRWCLKWVTKIKLIGPHDAVEHLKTHLIDLCNHYMR